MTWLWPIEGDVDPPEFIWMCSWCGNTICSHSHTDKCSHCGADEWITYVLDEEE